MTTASKARVVIVGAGFGGLTAAKAMRRLPVEITVIDRKNHHLFQPLLYQVATAGLSPSLIAVPIRSVLRRSENVEVLMAEVIGVDSSRRVVKLTDREVAYDYLILATGSQPSYFSHPEWEAIAPGLKTVDDATRIREKILLAFEEAEKEVDPVRKASLLTFAVIGGGPTGVEMAGSIAELARFALARDFRKIRPEQSRILLVEAGPRILASFPEDLVQGAKQRLESMGVEVITGERVQSVDPAGFVLSGQRILARNLIWAAGVAASPAARWLGTEADRAGRVKVQPDLSVPGHSEIYVIGDTATFTQDGKPLPGVAPVAMQQGRYVAESIRARLVQGPLPSRPFHYRDKGNLATVGRSFAIVDLGKIRLKGFLAWVTWIIVHIYYLIGFRSRVAVMIEWAWAYFTYGRGARLIR